MAQNAPQTRFVTLTPRSAKIVKKASPNLIRTKKTVLQFQVCFIIFFQQLSKLTLIHVNGLGKTCAVGTDCPAADQICGAGNVCFPCRAGSKPDEDKEKCNNGSSRLVSILQKVILAFISLGVVFLHL